MEPHFNYDFSPVRIHHDSAAAALTASVGARAYTLGHDIVFGSGEFAPNLAEGKRLLTHELAHVVQQGRSGVKAIQCDTTSRPPASPTPPDPEEVLGRRLVTDFPNGVAMAFYQSMPGPDKEAARSAAQGWAGRESALGFKGNGVAADRAAFGVAVADADYPMFQTLQALVPLLERSVAKAPLPPTGPTPPGMGPTTVRTLALFSHGNSYMSGMAHGPAPALHKPITRDNAASAIRNIASALGPTVNVVLYSCNGGRDMDVTEDWVKGTMEGGGKRSLAAATRDVLAAEQKTGGTVWGHTVTGHVSTNFALREFSAGAGAGEGGSPFVASYVFSTPDCLAAAYELIRLIVQLGFEVTTAGANESAERTVQRHMYACYAIANRDLLYNGGNLAESAPVHPVEVGRVIKDYWSASYWPGHRDKAAEALAKELVGQNLAKMT